MHPLIPLALLSLLALPAVARPAAEVATPTDPVAVSADETFTIGTLRVQQHGDSGQPVVLIPGLASGAWVWDDTIAHLRDSHVVYAVTLAGFDGVPAPQGDESYFDRAAESLVELIDSRNLEQPVLIGHSLGGTLALDIATLHADKLGGVIAVDGLPVFPGFERLSASDRQAHAKQIGAQMAGANAEQFQAMQLGYMQTIGVIDPALAMKTAGLTARSDPAATGRYAAEDLALDLRDRLSTATVPILEISPYNAPDFSAPPMVMSETEKVDYYRQLLAGAPQVDVVSISPSRHFVMLDQPRKFLETVDDFLATLVSP